MTEEDIINKLLNSPNLSIRTRTFVSDLKGKLKQFGALKEGQIKTLIKIYQEAGYAVKQQDTGEPRLKLVEIKGSCGQCKDGLLIVINPQGTYVFLCPCNVGKQRVEKYPTWSSQIEGTVMACSKDREVLDDKTKKELFEFLRESVNGFKSPEQVKATCDVVSSVLKQYGITPDHY